MESLLNRVNNETNEAMQRTTREITLQILFTDQRGGSHDFNAGIGVFNNDNSFYEHDVDAHFEFAQHFDLNVIFISLDLKRGEVVKTQSNIPQESSHALWNQTHKHIENFVKAKMKSISTKSETKFNNEWTHAYTAGNINTLIAEAK